MYCNIKLPEFLFLVGVSRLDVWDEENLGFFKFLSQKDYPKIRKGKCMMEADGCGWWTNKAILCCLRRGGVAFDFFKVIILSHANLCKDVSIFNGLVCGLWCSRDASACQLSLTAFTSLLFLVFFSIEVHGGIV